MATNEGFSAGSIFVALKANIEDFRSGMKFAISSLGGFVKEVGSAASKISTFGKQIASAMLAPVRAVGNLVSSLFSLKAIFAALLASKVFDEFVTAPARAAIQLERMAARAGLATEKLERLQFVVKAAGGNGDDVSVGLEKLNRILDDTRRGSQDFVPILEELGFLGLSINEIVDKVLSNPNLGAAGLKKLGVSELAVLTKLSREEVDKLLVSFVKLGNGTDAGLFKIANRLQVVKTKLAEAFHNVAEQVSGLILPPLLKGLELVERFIENHFPEILAFFDTVQQLTGQLFDAIKKTAQTPGKLVEALQITVDQIFETIGKTAIAFFDGFIKIGIEAFKALSAAIVILLGPLFNNMWEVVKIKLDVLLDKVKNAISDSMDDFLNSILPGWTDTQGDAAQRAAREAEIARLEAQDLTALSTSLQAANEQQTKSALATFTEHAAGVVKESKSSIQKIATELTESAGKILSAFGFSIEGFAVSNAANVARRRAEQQAALRALNPILEGPPVPEGLEAANSRDSAMAEQRKKEIEQTLAEARQGFSELIGGAFSGIHSFFNQVFIEGKSTMEALGDVAAKISDQFIGKTLDNLQKSLSDGLAAAFNDPKVGSAVANLAGALIGIAATVFSVFQNRKSKSSDRFSDVADVVTSTQRVRGIVAGPESVAIAAVGQDLQRALIPTNEILRAQLSFLSRILSAVRGGGGVSDFGFAGTVPTT